MGETRVGQVCVWTEWSGMAILLCEDQGKIFEVRCRLSFSRDTYG